MEEKVNSRTICRIYLELTLKGLLLFSIFEYEGAIANS